MRKNGLKILSMSLLLSTLCVAGCSCAKDKENVARITDGEILSGLTKDASDYSLVDVYEAMLTGDAGSIATANALIDFVATKVLELDKDPFKTKYEKLVDDKLEALKESEEYEFDGEFSEDLFVKDLLSKGYAIKKVNGVYDYTDYINKELRVDALSTLLKQKYIMEETLKNSKNVVTTKKIRDVEYLTVSSSIESTYSYYNEIDGLGNKTKVNIKARDFMNGIRDKIVADKDNNYANIDFDSYEVDLKELFELVIDTEVKKIYSAEDYTSELAAKYTANYTRSVEEGKKEKLDAIDKLEYSYDKVLSSDSDKTSIISESITSRLLNLSDPEAEEGKRVIKLGDWYYLVSPNAGANVDASDILLTESADGSTYTYSIVRFKVINADNYDAVAADGVKSNKDKVVELLANGSTLANGAVSHYLEKYKSTIKVNDDAVYEYLKKIYPDVFTD